MDGFNETSISQAIVSAYSDRLIERMESDVLIVGAGPAGLVAAFQLAEKGFAVTILEKRLSSGGGIWGGGMAMNQIVVQKEALYLLDRFGVRYRATKGGLYVADAVELASALSLRAVQSGAYLFNLITAEDICIRNGRASGVVGNRTTIYGALPVDPLVFSARAVLDSTGHDAALVNMVERRGLLGSRIPGEGAMDAYSGEKFVVERVCEVYPGLWVSGMAVCAAFGGPRMGPIFGGMLLSGEKAAEGIATSLGSKAKQQQ